MKNYMSNKIVLFACCLSALLSGCGDVPLHFSCKPQFAGGRISSLSVKNNIATFNASTYEALCRKNGNILVFGKNKKNCESFMDAKEEKPYEVLVFDEVIYRVTVATSLSGAGHFMEEYSCTKLN